MKYVFWLVVLIATAGTSAAERSPKPPLTVAEVVARNTEARGGLEAWRRIDTMIWIGRIEGDKAPPEGLPFMLEMKRPRKTRFEVKGPVQQGVRAFDGKDGWKAHPRANGQQEVKAFTAEELQFAKDGEGLDGLLIDCEAKGIQVKLEGEDKIEGTPAYRLRVVMPSGAARRVWVDARNFLELRQDREARTAAGVAGIVQVRYGNYQTVGDVKIPMTIETGAASAKAADRMVIERVAINPPLDDRRFTRPHVPHSNVVTVVPEPARSSLPSQPSRPPSAAATPPSANGVAAPTSDVPEPR